MGCLVSPPGRGGRGSRRKVQANREARARRSANRWTAWPGGGGTPSEVAPSVVYKARRPQNPICPQSQDTEEKTPELEIPGTHTLRASDEEVARAGQGNSSGSEAGSPPSLPVRSPAPRLGEDMEAYVLRPARQGCMVQCLINRNKRGVDKGMFPFYYLYLEAAEGRKV